MWEDIYNEVMCTQMQELVAHKSKYVKYITTTQYKIGMVAWSSKGWKHTRVEQK